MLKLLEYNQDGANYQARAVLAYLQRHDGIESSWDGDCYCMEAAVSRWENCREQGYVVVIRSRDFSEQMNIAFFEHRNSDSICAVKWNQTTTNAPTIDNADFGDVYKDKYDVSKRVSYGQAEEMATWIWAQLEEFCTKAMKQEVV
jgi:hypothetical protein